MRGIFNFFINVSLSLLLLIGRVEAQSNTCNCWINRDTSFHVVQFAGYTPPYYANDDGSSNAIALPFNFCFWGVPKDSVFINTNGNVTFGSGFSTYTSDSFPTADVQIIAPFWADVDIDLSLSYPPASGAVYYKITPTYMVVQWDSVGYVGPRWCASFPRYAAYDKTNTFQLIISNGSDPIIPNGNNVEFCYKDMEWTTGADSPGPCTDGGKGFGGAPATVGANEGDSSRYVQIGLFDTASFSYAGQFPPAPNYDGVYWLDNKSFIFNLCSGTIAPLSSGISPCDTFRICQGDSVFIPLYFFSPTQGDSIWSNLSAPFIPGVSIISNKPGNTDSLVIRVIGSASNLGYHVIHVYGYDNQKPPDTTYASFVIEVDTAAPKVLLTAVRDTICIGDTSTLTATGGRFYNWSTGATSSVIKVSPGVTQTYTIGVSNGGCTKDTSIKVVVLPRPVPLITAKPDTTCAGDSVLLIAGGGGTYKWSTGQTHDTIKIATASTTTYTLTVSNGACTNATTVTVHIIPPITPTINIIKDSLCPNDTTTLAATGGTYKWLPGLQTTATITVKPNITTTYSVIVTTPCGKDTLSKTLHIIPLPVVTTSGNPVICSGADTTIFATGGGTYLWAPGGSTNSSINVSPASTTTYTVAVSNGKCVKDTTIKVTVNKVPVITITPPQKVCPNSRVTLTATGGPSYKWSTGATTSTITVTPASTTSYTVVVSNGCADSASTVITVDVPALTACCNDTITKGDTVTINASGESNYSWSPPSGLSCTVCPNPTASPTVTTTYTVLSNDPNGCPVERAITIFVEVPCADFTVPNVFTPNNDGINDDFVINVLNPVSYSIIIYDRWGKEVYKSGDPTMYWNGRLLSTQYLVPDGTYYYIIKAACGSNEYVKKGFVQVIGGY